MSIHKNYLKLTADEKAFVDDMFSAKTFGRALGAIGHNLNNCDAAERAVEAVATWVINSRVLKLGNKPMKEIKIPSKQEYDFRIDCWTEEMYLAIPWSDKAKDWAKANEYFDGRIEIDEKALEGFLDNLDFQGLTYDETY